MHHLISLDPFSIFNVPFSGTPCLLPVIFGGEERYCPSLGTLLEAMKGSNSSNSRNHSNIFKSTQIESDLFKSVQRPLFFCTQYGTLCHPVVISSRVYLLTLAGRTPSVALPVVLQTPRSGHWWNCCSCSACPIKIPLVLSKARACAAFCGVVLCASGNHSLPSQKSFQAVKECKQQKSKECSFPLSTLNCFSVESMNFCYCVAAIHLTSTARKNGPPSGAVQAAWHSQITHAFV